MTKLKTTPFDPAEYLDNDEAVVGYLADAFETGDEAFIIDAIGVAARAKGMSAIARDADMSRPSLYKALSATGSPQFSTILNVLKALGVTLEAKPAA